MAKKMDPLAKLAGIGKVKGSSGKPKLARAKKPRPQSTSQYRNKGY